MWVFADRKIVHFHTLLTQMIWRESISFGRKLLAHNAYKRYSFVEIIFRELRPGTIIVWKNFTTLYIIRIQTGICFNMSIPHVSVRDIILESPELKIVMTHNNITTLIFRNSFRTFAELVIVIVRELSQGYLVDIYNLAI